MHTFGLKSSNAIGHDKRAFYRYSLSLSNGFPGERRICGEKKTQLDAKCSLVTDTESTKKRRMLDTITNDYLCAPARVSMAYVGI